MVSGPVVIGIDTRTRAFHWASGDGFGWSHGGFVSRQEDHDVARAELFAFARRFFEDSADRVHVFCEAPLALKNGATTRLLCMAASAVFCGYIASEANGFWYWIDPSTWKKDVLGRGAPPKGQKHKPWIRERVLELWPHVIAVEPVKSQFDLEPDLYDAWCLMRYGRRVVDSPDGR